MFRRRSNRPSPTGSTLLSAMVSVRRAKEMGLGAILVTPGKEAISSSIFKALEIAAVRRQERIRAERFKNILNYSHEGILATDQEGTIVVVNPAGRRSSVLMRLNSGAKGHEVLPFLQLDEELHANRQTWARSRLGKPGCAEHRSGQNRPWVCRTDYYFPKGGVLRGH